MKHLRIQPVLKAQQINENHIIDFGELILTVKEINIIKYTTNQFQNKKNNTSDKMCRFCLSESNKQYDNLINVCNCTGSLEYVHLSCIRKWVAQKIKVKCINRNIVLYWEKAICELCQQQLQFIYELDNQKYHLYSFHKFISNNYILLEAKHKQIQNSKAIFIMNLDERKKILIGEARKNDIRIISNHQKHNYSLQFSKNKVYLKNHTR